MSRMKFMNTEIDNLTMEETLQAVDQLIQEDKSSYVVTPNVDHIVQLETSKELQAVYDNASLILTDGKPLLWIAKWYGTPIKEKISGSDLFPLLCDMAAKKGYKMFFLGAAEGVAAKAAKNLAKRYKGLQVVGTYSPPFGFENNVDEMNKIKEMSNKEIEDKEDDKKVFINISRHLESHKKITRIINSAEKLDKEGYKNFKVWLLGDGEDHAMYRNLINEKHLENIVILKGNQVNPYKYLAKSDCLIMSSQFEGYGIVIDEARVLEKPIIATDIADARRILSEGYGIVCENSEEGIYDAMKDCLNRNYKIAQKFDYKEFNKNVDKNLKKAIDYCVQDNK